MNPVHPIKLGQPEYPVSPWCNAVVTDFLNASTPPACVHHYSQSVDQERLPSTLPLPGSSFTSLRNTSFLTGASASWSPSNLPVRRHSRAHEDRVCHAEAQSPQSFRNCPPAAPPLACAKATSLGLESGGAFLFLVFCVCSSLPAETAQDHAASARESL